MQNLQTAPDNSQRQWLLSSLMELEQLKRELAARTARQSLLAFTEYTNPLYRRARHHELIAEKLEAVERGEIDRLMIFMPPRHGKSELASKRFPAWCLGRDPMRQIIAASYNSDLANDFGRNVRNLVAEPEFSEVFRGVTLAPDSQAANRMNTNHGGTYVAAGVGTAVTGRGAHIALIDDPFKDREEADSQRRRDMVWDWYRSTLYTRLMPGGAVVVVQCMTGDTPVLMAAGDEKPLRDIRLGDRIATYENGGITSSIVRNWANQGSDLVYEIRMISGITVKANERHPFLVVRNGEQQWTKLKDIHAGDQILRAIGGNGGVRTVLSKIAESPPERGAFVIPTTTRTSGQEATDRPLPLTLTGDATQNSSIAMASVSLNTMQCLNNKVVSAQFASAPLRTVRRSIGVTPSVLITTTQQGEFADCSATTATLSSDEAVMPQLSGEHLNTLSVTNDTVLSIRPCGREDVFDIQVDRTENFIANGLVSHNTRWNEDDLAGRLLENEGDQWEVLDLPAINKDGDALWPEWYPVAALERIKATIGPREWSALYQQQPQPDDGTFFKREYFKEWSSLPGLRYYGTSDYAVTDGGGDWTVHRIWGVDSKGDIYRVDGWRGQTTADVWIDRKLDLVARYKPLMWFGEGGVIQKAIEPMLINQMRARNVHCAMEWMPSVADKPTRARSFQAMAATGRVYFEHGADLSEFLVFPAGKHDDEVDTASLIGRAMDQVIPASLPRERKSQYQGAGGWMV